MREVCTFVDRLLLESWTKKQFKKQIQMKDITFVILCNKFSPSLKKEYIHFRIIEVVQNMVAMSLYRLGYDDGLQNMGGLYGVHKSAVLKIAREFYRATRNHL